MLSSNLVEYFSKHPDGTAVDPSHQSTKEASVMYGYDRMSHLVS